jgi:hypothetical protein
MSLDPSAFVDTSNWAGELSTSSGAQPAHKRSARPSAIRGKHNRTPRAPRLLAQP